MKPRAKMIVLFLLLGAIINVAVAWGCALWINIGSSNSAHGAVTRDGGYWGVVRMGRQGGIVVRSSRSSAGVRKDHSVSWQDPLVLVPSWTGFQVPTIGYANGAVQREMRYAEGRGWPAISMWYEADSSGDGTSVDPVPVHGGLEVSAWPSSYEKHAYSRSLPLRIVPIGFSLDTFLYASLLWLFFSFPLTLRRRRRIKRGLCPKCAYDLRGSTLQICPECAKPIVNRAVIG